jgi:hypothetical protein
MMCVMAAAAAHAGVPSRAVLEACQTLLAVVCCCHVLCAAGTATHMRNTHAQGLSPVQALVRLAPLAVSALAALARFCQFVCVCVCVCDVHCFFGP